MPRTRWVVNDGTPCVLFNCGHCQSGDKCKLSHVPHSGYYKHITCQFHERGCCKMGDECPFSHDWVSPVSIRVNFFTLEWLSLNSPLCFHQRIQLSNIFLLVWCRFTGCWDESCHHASSSRILYISFAFELNMNTCLPVHFGGVVQLSEQLGTSSAYMLVNQTGKFPMMHFY